MITCVAVRRAVSGSKPLTRNDSASASMPRETPLSLYEPRPAQQAEIRL